MKRQSIGIIVILLVTLLLASCKSGGTAAPTQSNDTGGDQSNYPAPEGNSVVDQSVYPAPALPGGALFQVLKADGSAKAFNADDLKKFTTAKITVDGETTEGVKLVDVLSAAGVTEYSRLTLVGENNTTTGIVKELVTDEVLLTASAPVSLAATTMAKTEWVKGITLIVVRE
jgi:hypothetical protein